MLDVPPKILKQGGGSGRPQIASRGDTFGVVVNQDLADGVSFFLVAAGGEVSGPKLLGKWLGGAPPTIASSASGFAITTLTDSDAGQTVTVRGLDSAGAETWTLGVPVVTYVAHGLLVGSPSAYWLTVNNVLRALPISADGAQQGGFSSLGSVYCCSNRNWTGVAISNGLLAYWQDQGTFRLARVESSGSVSQLGSPFDSTFAPAYAGELAGNAFFGDCEWLYLVTPLGAVVSKTPLAQKEYSCSVASSGPVLRMATAGSSGVTWRAVTEKTGPSSPLAISTDSAGQVATASDGKGGFGVVWQLGGDVMYAHVTACGG